jgi:glycosyltransferase involved in cell wall biosynthesis
MGNTDRKFVVASPYRTSHDDPARALEIFGLLRFYALGTRRGTAGVPPEHTRLNPLIGLISYAAARTLSPFTAESIRFGLYRWLDAWVRGQLVPGDHIISSFAMANSSFQWVRAHGGKTFLDAGNSHPENFWSIVSEEHRRWGWRLPPVAEHYHRRSVAMMADVDYVLSPSSYVSDSFLERGFRPEQIFRIIYPVDFTHFTPSPAPRPADRPLTVISTGSLSLRKGTPYLLEAFRIVRRREPTARLLLTQVVMDSARPVLRKYSDLPIEWAGHLPHPLLAERLRSADIFVLPTLEEGLVRTATEALACGLPAIVTPNSGVNDFIVPDVNGTVVPIRDPQAIADAILSWYERIRSRSGPPPQLLSPEQFSFEAFVRTFRGHIRDLGFLE